VKDIRVTEKRAKRTIRVKNAIKMQLVRMPDIVENNACATLDLKAMAKPVRRKKVHVEIAMPTQNVKPKVNQF